MKKRRMKGLDVSKLKNLDFKYHCCAEAKFENKILSSDSENRATEPLELCSADTFGPLPV